MLVGGAAACGADTGRGRDSSNPFSATTVQTLHYAGRVIERGKKGGGERRDGEDYNEEGGGRQRHAARLNQQPLVFNPPQKVRTTFFYRTTAAKPLWHRTSCLVE